MLQVSDLKKNYGLHESVKGISFRADLHEVIGLLGPNGAGKTTIMRMLAGYLAPSGGEISVGGIPMAEKPQDAKRLIGYLPEIPPLYSYMTVMEHLSFVCSLRDIKGRDARRESERVCELLSITDVSHRAIGQLSKGYRQRVGFAAALIGEPKLLILDEPTVGLDPQQVIEIRSLIRTLSQEMTVLISSHILTEIAGVCSRLLFLFEGRLLADGNMEAITKTYRKSISTAVSVRAKPGAAEKVMHQCAQQHDYIIDQTRYESGETHFVLSSPDGTPAEEIIFCAFAPLCPDMVITQLYTPAPSLEEIFLDITKASAGPGKSETA